MMRLITSCLIVLAAGCAADDQDVPDLSARVQFSWGGQDGRQFINDTVPSTRSGPIKPCPDWGSADGPVSAVTATITIDQYESVQTFPCTLGAATIAVPPGSGMILLGDVLGPNADSPDLSTRPVSIAAGQTIVLDPLELDQDVFVQDGGGGDDGDEGGIF